MAAGDAVETDLLRAAQDRTVACDIGAERLAYGISPYPHGGGITLSDRPPLYQNRPDVVPVRPLTAHTAARTLPSIAIPAT